MRLALNDACAVWSRVVQGSVVQCTLDGGLFLFTLAWLYVSCCECATRPRTACCEYDGIRKALSSLALTVMVMAMFNARRWKGVEYPIRSTSLSL